MTLKFCCDTFRLRTESFFDRGFNVHFETGDGLDEFVLQHRARDHKNKDAIPLNVPYAISLVSRVVIQCCPWCGVSLKSFYRKNLDHFIPDIDNALDG